MSFPLGEVIGVISELCLGSHASMSEITIVLIVVSQAQMVIEIVLILVDCHLIIFIP